MSTTATATTVVQVPIVDATPENVQPFGQLIGDDMANPGLGIPCYQGRVLEDKTSTFNTPVEPLSVRLRSCPDIHLCSGWSATCV
jgi:hypothetical protein